MCRAAPRPPLWSTRHCCACPLQARQPGLFEIKVTTPPPRSLGIYALPPLTHTGEEIEIDGQGYIVTALNVHFRLGGCAGGRRVRWRAGAWRGVVRAGEPAL